MHRGRYLQGVLFLFAGIVVSVGWFISGQFVLKRKEKKFSGVSTTVLREQCAQEMGDILQIIPDIMHELANIQSAELTHIYAFFNGEKQCFLLSANKDQLYDLQIKLTVHKQHLVRVKQILQEQGSFLQLLELEKSKSSNVVNNSV